MKVRTDFVTNSSSSSFILIYEIGYDEEYKKKLEKRLGEVGKELAEKYFVKNDDEIAYMLGNDFDETKTYFMVTHYTYTDDEDDFNNPDVFLEMYMPKENTNLVYEGE